VIQTTQTRRLIGAVLLIIAAAVVVIVHYSQPPASSRFRPSASPSPRTSEVIQFGTLPPGAKLPSAAQCARWVHASPSPENRPANKTSNGTIGQHVGPGFFPAGDSPQVRTLVPLISGDFTGTTEEILRWAACKWGISQNIVFAQAAVESWWRQDNLGDWRADAKLCPPGHGVGADGRPGACPQSYGILQTRYPYLETSWPGIGTSTAMNADVTYAIWRSCYDGYEVWLNNEPRGQQYHAGDLWGCVGRWYAGSWHTPAANEYIGVVKQYLQERVWEQPDFN
jgi:autotransporter family porin